MGDKEKTKIEGVLLVACLICERTPGKMPYLLIKDSYPATYLVNVPTQRGSVSSQPAPAYLCGEHYDKYL